MVWGYIPQSRATGLSGKPKPLNLSVVLKESTGWLRGRSLNPKPQTLNPKTQNP